MILLGWYQRSGKRTGLHITIVDLDAPDVLLDRIYCTCRLYHTCGLVQMRLTNVPASVLKDRTAMYEKLHKL